MNIKFILLTQNASQASEMNNARANNCIEFQAPILHQCSLLFATYFHRIK